MAQYFQGILGPFHGTVGTVVGYLWRDRWCMRARPRHYHDRRSAAQLEQRSRFKAMIQFASPATSLLRIGLRTLAADRRLTEGNCFLQLNNAHFGSGTVDYARLRFSHGHLPGVQLTGAELDAGGAATVQWGKLGGRNEDRLHLYAYCPAAGTGLMVATVERGRRRARFVLPSEFAGAEVHLWAVAENAQGEVSETAYLLLAPDSSAAAAPPDTTTTSTTADYIPSRNLTDTTPASHADASMPPPAGQDTGLIPKDQP